MSAVPRPHRDAMQGEIVLLFENGDPSGPSMPAMVSEAGKGWATLVYSKPGSITSLCRKYVKHIHDVFWDNATVQQKQSNGAYEFHPVYKCLFDKWISAADAREVARQNREAAKADMSADDFNALNALDKYGDNMLKICDETGLTLAKLRKLPQFSEALKALKQQNWEEKNALEPVKAE
jgi:hypothetical protein